MYFSHWRAAGETGVYGPASHFLDVFNHPRLCVLSSDLLFFFSAALETTQTEMSSHMRLVLTLHENQHSSGHILWHLMKKIFIEEKKTKKKRFETKFSSTTAGIKRCLWVTDDFLSSRFEITPRWFCPEFYTHSHFTNTKTAMKRVRMHKHTHVYSGCVLKYSFDVLVLQFFLHCIYPNYCSYSKKSNVSPKKKQPCFSLKTTIYFRHYWKISGYEVFP